MPPPVIFPPPIVHSGGTGSFPIPVWLFFLVIGIAVVIVGVVLYFAWQDEREWRKRHNRPTQK